MSVKNNSKLTPSTPWLLLGVGYLLWAVIMSHWLSTPAWLIKSQLPRFVPRFLWIDLGVIVLACLWNLDGLKEIWNGYFKKQGVWLAGIAVLAFSLAHGVAPRTHRIYYDEDIYEAIGLNLSQNNQAAIAEDGRWDSGRFHSLDSYYSRQPAGWPFLINLAYRIFGSTENVSFDLNNLLFAVAVIGVFLCSLLLFENAWAALFAALIYATLPENVRWFCAAAVDPPSACITLLAITGTLLFFKTRTFKSLLLAASLWALAVQFRLEVFLLGAWVVVLFYVDGQDEWRRPRIYAALLLFLFLVSAHLGHIYVVHADPWGSSGDKLAVRFMPQNLRINTLYFFNSKKFPLGVTLLALAGLGLPHSGKSKVYAALWFILTWGVYLFFYAGSYDYGASVRFSLPSLAPLALLAGRGLEQMVTLLKRRLKQGPAIVMLLLGVNFLAYLPQMRTIGQDGWQARMDHQAAEQFARQIPADGIILTHNPNMFQVWGKNAALLALFIDNAAYASSKIEPAFPGKVYFHWNYWCSAQDPVQRGYCEKMLDHYKLELVQEWPAKELHLALYRVLGVKSERQ